MLIAENTGMGTPLMGDKKRDDDPAHPPEPRTESPLRVPVAAGTRSYGSLED